MKKCTGYLRKLSCRGGDTSLISGESFDDVKCPHRLREGETSPFIPFIIVFLVILLINSTVLALDSKIPQIDIRGDSIYLDGKKFFIKGIGWSPYRPGQWPGSPVPPETAEADFKRIREAGFNTLRVWGTMPEEQLRLADKYGLKVIQAVPLKSDADFGYSGYIRMAESSTSEMCKVSKDHPNVIMYLLMNEPHADAVVKSGVENTLALYKRLIKIIREEDPDRPISMANAFWTLWLDQSMWDAVSFNTYDYWPSMVPDIGYANFVKNLKSLHSKNRPFLVTEFGFSVSPDGSGGGTYGGNTEKEQAEGLIKCFRELIEGGAAGGCVFEWNDEWWKAKNPAVHDSHQEEWFGIIGIEDKDNPLGTPRTAYYSLKEELKLVVIEPKEGERVLEGANIEVNSAPSVTDVQFRIDDGEWRDLSQTDDWWRGKIDGSNIEPGLHVLTLKGIENGKELTRRLNIIRCRDKNDMLPPLNIELTTDKPSYKNGDLTRLKTRLTDRDGTPLKNHPVKLGIFNAMSNFSECWEGMTDENGSFSKAVRVVGGLDEWYYVYWAVAETGDYNYKERIAAIGYVRAEIGEGFPINWLTAKKRGLIEIDGIMEGVWQKTDKIELNADSAFMEGTIDSPEDLSAEVRILWDEGNIYLLANVKDDVPAQNKFAKTDIWNGDCIELFISVDPEKIPEAGYSGSDFQILIGANGWMWIPHQANGGVRNDIPKLSKAVMKKNDTGYVLEAKINIANFWDKPFRVFKKGDILGFDVAIGDADEKGTREGKLIWNGTGDGYRNSAVWGRIKLE